MLGGTSPPTKPHRAPSPNGGTFILAKLGAADAARLKDVMPDVYRDAVPDPMDITKFEWEVSLRFMGADAEEIRDVQPRSRMLGARKPAGVTTISPTSV